MQHFATQSLKSFTFALCLSINMHLLEFPNTLHNSTWPDVFCLRLGQPRWQTTKHTEYISDTKIHCLAVIPTLTPNTHFVPAVGIDSIWPIELYSVSFCSFVLLLLLAKGATSIYLSQSLCEILIWNATAPMRLHAQCKCNWITLLLYSTETNTSLPCKHKTFCSRRRWKRWKIEAK